MVGGDKAAMRFLALSGKRRILGDLELYIFFSQVFS
jgi:hypothetical protein